MLRMKSIQRIKTTTKPNISAAIHIGASSLSMLISSRTSDGTLSPLDFLEQPISVAHDIFGKGEIERSTIERCARVISGYLETIREFGDPSPIIRAVGTNILSEASNYETLLNRLNVVCGLTIEPLDDGEMTRLIFLKTKRRLSDTPSLQKRKTLVVHVGPGNTRALLFDKGRIIRYTSYRLGAHRTAEAIDASNSSGSALIQLIREHISGQISQLYYDFVDDKIEDLVMIGYELQTLTPFLAKSGESKSSTKILKQISSDASNLTEDEIVRRYKVDYNTSQAIIPAIEINLSIAEAFDLKEIRVPGSDYEKGLLQDLLISSSLTNIFQQEVIRSAELIAERYHANDHHGKHVTFLCQRLFEETQALHQLDSHDALLLKVAAILHEVGGYISPRAHHLHSEYIILHSDIFGLSHSDVTIIALIARYHRNEGPKTTHQHYKELNTADRIRVSKLASIIRVADALERSHSSRVTDIKTKITEKKFHLYLKGVTTSAVEHLAMRSKGDVFQDIFGLDIVLHDS